MYNFKEKKLHFNALRNPDAAAFDLELLQKNSPIHPNLRTFSRDPKRYCDDILYALLELISREDIRAFRRAKQEEAMQPIPEKTLGGDSDNPPPTIEAEERTDAAESALKEEKKKEKPEPTVTPVKSKSTKNTHKSTGTTSSTRKSK